MFRIVFFIILVLLFVPTVRADIIPVETDSVAVISGDVNRDGTINVFDLLAILRQVSGKEPATESSDLDANGRTDIFDLLALLRMMNEMREPLEVAATVGYHLLTGPAVHAFSRFDENNEVRDQYHIYSNKEIVRAELILDGDTVTGISGTTPVILAADPDTIQFDRDAIFYTEQKRWKVNAWDASGRCASDSGISNFQILDSGVVVDVSLPNVSDEIKFPLTLYGKTQRFGIEVDLSGTSWGNVLFPVDLNPAGDNSVVYQNMEELADQVIDQVTSDDSLYHFFPLYAAAGYSWDTGLIVNRLVIDPLAMATWAEIVPLDGNTKLMSLLGYTPWKQVDYSLTNNQNYRYSPEVYRAMREK